MENTSPAREFGPLWHAADECLVFDLDGRVVAANPAALAALECGADELTGRHAWEIVTCLSKHGFQRVLAAMRSEGPQKLLGHLKQRGGGLLSTDTRLWLAPFHGAEHVFALARELRVCQGVLEERDQLVHLMEASSEVVLLFDPELHAIFANRAAQEMLGFQHNEDMQGLLLSEIVVPAQRAQLEEDVLPHLGRKDWSGELELRSWRDPAARTPCWVQLFELRDSRAKKRAGYALTARDDRPRRSAEERRSRLLALSEVSRLVAVQLLREDDLNECVFAILAGVASAIGAPRAYLNRFREDGRWLLRTHEWSREHGPRQQRGGASGPAGDYRWASEILERGECVRIQDAEILASAGGGRGLLESEERALLLLPARIGGAVQNVFGFVDTSSRGWDDDEVAAVQLIVDAFATGVERRIAEREKRRAQRALEQAVENEKRANRYKSEFLASMSHELRTPMNAIRGYAELLARPKAERALQELWVQNLRRSTEYLLGLMHDVLDLSKIEAGHMQLALEPTALAEVLCSVRDLLSHQAREKALEFSVALEGACPESFESDPVRLKQILVNLVSNAVKFTAQGSVRVRAHRVGEGLEITVSDTGIGIPAAAQEKLFRPFSQVHQRAGGTGLGLQISRSLARLLGGDVTVASAEGKGSTFTLALPLKGARGTLAELPAPGANLEKTRSLPIQLQGRRFLVVDDSAENREVLRWLLHEAGASTECAANGKLGIERALAAQQAHEPFDVILMDMNMPILDGFEATRALVQAGVTSPVIALTAMALAGDEERCRAAGCVAYLGKPIVPSIFFETLARHVGPPAVAPERARAVQESQRPSPEDALASLTQHPRFRGLVERYVASFPELATHLRERFAAGDLDEVRTLVHRLRGTAATYGFPDVSSTAGRCEDAIRAGAARDDIGRALEAVLGRLTLAAAG
jgi:signal transduction histidine kinase/FixJ family two-component response regulator/PAS domain-containing protein